MKRAAAAVLVAACHPAPPTSPAPPLPREAYAHYLQGKLLAYRGEWPAAADELAAAAAAEPGQPMIAVERARAQVRAKRPADARATLAAARKRWPDHPQVWLASGDVLAATDKPGAIAAYHRAIELQPDDERAYLGVAKLEAPPVAEKALRELVQRAPGSVEGHYRLAIRFADQGDLAAATRELRAVLERDPDHIDGRLDLARALRRQGQLADAIAETRSAFDRSGQAMDLAEELFWLLCEADDRTAAIDLLTLLDDDRSDLDALGAVARLDRGLGRLDEARAIGKRIAALDRDAGALSLAETELAAGDLAAARKAVALVDASGKRATDAQRVAADIAFAANDPAAALAAVAPANPKDLGAALAAAFALSDLGRPDEARARLAPFGDSPAAQLARARLADRAGDAKTALALVEPIARARPDVSAALNLAGYLLADAKQRLPDAEAYLRRARAASPGDPAVLDSWGWYLFARGDLAGAKRAIEHASRFAPREPELYLHLAAIAVQQRDARGAGKLLDAAVALHPPAALQHRIDAMRARVVIR